MIERAPAGAPDNIRILEGWEAVRRRPSAFVGGTDARAMHTLVLEVVDNSVEEALAGRCDRIAVTIHPDASVSVADNGGGIPIALHPTFRNKAGEPVSMLEVALTQLYSGAKFEGAAHTGAHSPLGLGVAVVNALSAALTVQVRRGGQIHQQDYREGRPVSAVVEAGTCAPDDSGTRITFLRDPGIFGPHSHYDFDQLATRFRALARLAPGVALSLRDERDGREETLRFTPD